jgi:hypothetical protein
MKRCPFDGCSARVDDTKFSCSRHWLKVPADVRERLSDAFRSYRSNEISLSEFRLVQAQCVASVDGCVKKPAAAAARPLAWLTCPHCGANVAVPAMGSFAFHTVMELNADGNFVVVGGVAYANDGQWPEQYARFCHHACFGRAMLRSDNLFEALAAAASGPKRKAS